MKIHIITGHFYPQLHPRAFRANELALEFARRGYDVTVTNCWTINGFDYDEYARKNGFKIRNLNLFHSNLDNEVGNSVTNIYRSGIISKLKNYLLAGSLFYRGPLIAKGIQISDDTDLVITSSQPFTCHYGLSLYIKKHGKKWPVVADSGDPFYNSEQSPKAFWFYFITKSIYKKFDYLTIPTENAIPLYAPVIEESKIRIIPQGFRMDNLKLYKGDFKGVPRFAYAGVFYQDIRNPSFLFDYLASKDSPFEFYLFMREKDAFVDELIKERPSLKDKIKIAYSKPHDELIYELSRMNFLINIENDSNTQMPSKLIDYGMTGRPIFSCKRDTFSKEKFDGFMKGNYEGDYKVDVQKYNIVNIANNILKLVKDR